MRGIITATDSNVASFSGLKLLIASLNLTNPELPIAVVDTGMTGEQREQIIPLPRLSVIDAPPPIYQGDVWYWWNKPTYLRNSPFEDSLWLDTDCLVMGSLDYLYERIELAPVFVEDCARTMSHQFLANLPNKPGLYDRFPAEFKTKDGPFLNGGVIGFRTSREAWLFEEAYRLIRECDKDKTLASMVSLGDQGIFQWLVEKYNLYSFIVCDSTWNHIAPFGGDRKPYFGYDGPLGFIRELLPIASIAHFASSPKPYGDLTDISQGEIELALKSILVDKLSNILTYVPQYTDRKPKVAIFIPTAWGGGVEEWVGHLTRFVDVDFVGVGVTNKDRAHSFSLDQYADYEPSVGERACQDLMSRCDISLTWGVLGLNNLVVDKYDRPIIISVSHNAIQSDYDTRVFSQPCIDYIAAISQQALTPIPTEKLGEVQIIPNTLDFDRLTPTKPVDEIRRWLRIKPRQRIIGYVGRPDKLLKNTLAVAGAIAHMPEEWAAVFVGISPHAEEIMEEAYRLAPGRIYWAGARRDVANFYQIMERLIVPSRKESCCLVALEACASGLPLIMTPTGVITENPRLARHIKIDGSYEELANVILDDVNRAGEAKARSYHAKSFVEEKFSNDWFAENWKNFFGRCLTHGKRGL